MDHWQKIVQDDGAEEWIAIIAFNPTYDPLQLKVFEGAGGWMFEITHPDVDAVLAHGAAADLDTACTAAFEATRDAAQSVLDQFQ